VFETVLDAIRHGSLAAPDVIDVLFSSTDLLSDLLESARSDVRPENYEADGRTALSG
jgi:chemotaxis protein histidine kinase CheA